MTMRKLDALFSGFSKMHELSHADSGEYTEDGEYKPRRANKSEYGPVSDDEIMASARSCMGMFGGITVRKTDKVPAGNLPSHWMDGLD